MKDLEIAVNQVDIENGVRCDTGKCPIALAFKRAVPGALGLQVWDDDEAVSWSDETGKLWSAELPEEAQDFVINFDAEDPVEPLSFVLSPFEVDYDEDEEDDE